MAAAALAIGTGLAAYGNIRAGESKKAAYELEASAKESQAQQVELAAAREIELTQKRYNRTKSAQIVAFGKSGVLLQGSPLMLMEESAADAYDEMQSIRMAADYRKSTLRTEAGLSRFLGDEAELSGYLSGASSILTGVASNPYLYDSARVGVSTDKPWSGGPIKR
jgi:hypothetical protein